MLTVTRWVDVITNRVDIPARVLMSLLFLASGVGKISAVAATQAKKSRNIPMLSLAEDWCYFGNQVSAKPTLAHFSWVWQPRQFVRRLALRVPQAAHLMYMARAKRLVIRALVPSITTKTRMFRRASFN